MVDEIANHGYAIRTYVRESTVLASSGYLGSNQKIFIGFPWSKDNPIHVPPYQDMIIILVGRGGRGDIGLGLFEDRVDFFCYGQNDDKCKKIARALINYFNPVDVRRKTSFTRQNCQVNSMTQEGGALTLPDPDAADWPYTVVTYICQFNGTARP